MSQDNADVVIANMRFKKEKSKGFAHKCLTILAIFILVALLYGCIMGGVNDLTMLYTLDTKPLYVKERSAVIAVYVMIPTFVSLILVIILGFFNLSNDKLGMFFIKTGMYTFPLFLLLSVPTNYVAEQRLKDHGYSYCYWYTGKGITNPDIWVREAEYCQQSNNSVIFDMFVWLDKRVAEHNEPTPAEVNVFLTEGLKAHKKEFSLIYDD